MAKEDDIIKKKLKLYADADDKFLNSLTSVEKSIFREVVKLLEKFESKGGQLQAGEGFLMLINSLNDKIEKVINNSALGDKVDDYLKNFNRLDDLNQELHKEVNDIKLTKVNLNPVKTDAIRGLSANLASPESLHPNLVQPIKDIMFRSISTGISFVEARKLLEDFITGGPKRLGHMRRWAGQIARDALNQYDGLVNDIIREEYGLNAYRYVGSLVEDSRPQCVRWVGMEVLPFDSLASEIKWANNNGKGMIPGTVPANFATFRGGYNCRHMAIPFRQEEKK